MDVRTPKNKARLLNVYKIIIAAFAILLLLLPKGITSMPEIETKLLLTVMGIDKIETGYRVSATAVMPQESQNGSTKRLNVGAEGSSISDALEKLSLKMGKKLELGLCGLIVVGDTFGSENMLPHLNYFISSGKIIPGAYLVLSPDKSAKETIEMSNLLSEASSNGLSNLIEHNAIGTSMPAVTLLKFLSESNSVSKCAYIPCIEIQEKQSELDKGGGSGTGDSTSGEEESGGGSDSKGKETEIKDLSRIAFYQDGVKLYMLSDEETKGYTWFDKTSTQGLVELDDFSAGGISVGKVYCQLRDKKFKIRTSLDGGKPKAVLSVDALLELEDRHKLSNLYKYNGVDEKELNDSIVMQYREKIQSEIDLAVNVMKGLDCDAVGLVNDLYKHHFKQYREYGDKDNLFSDMTIEYDIKVKFK